jgi:hypothetical protein
LVVSDFWNLFGYRINAAACGLPALLGEKYIWYISQAAVLLCIVFDDREVFGKCERCCFR